MTEKKSDILTPVAVAAGIAGMAVGGYLLFKKGAPPADPGVISKQGVVYNNNSLSAAPGQAISVAITLKNTGLSKVTPKFRVDIEETGVLESPLEGVWKTSPVVAPEQTITVNVSSRQIPLDWDGDMRAYVMLEGVEGHWDESPNLTLAATGSIVKESVIYNDNLPDIMPGQPVIVDITWRNNGTTSVSPRFRVDIRKNGLFETIQEGQWFTSSPVSPGQPVVITGQSIPIPNDWSEGTQLRAYVMLEGVEGHWDESPALTVVVSNSGNIAFSLQLVNAQLAFPGATTWLVYYNDPILGAFSDFTSHGIADKVNFPPMTSGGWFAVFLYNAAGNESPRIDSPPIVLFGNDVLLLNCLDGSVTGL
jgi:hypothetical protein